MACGRQVDNALTAAQSVLFPKGLDTAVATSRQQHAANVEAANEAREAYLTKASLLSLVGCWQRFSGAIACIALVQPRCREEAVLPHRSFSKARCLMLCSESRQWHGIVVRLVPGGVQVEEALSFLQAAGLSGAAKYAAGTVLCCVDEAQKIPLALEREAELVLLRVTEAWQKLVSLPPGEAQPRTGIGCTMRLSAATQLALQGVPHLLVAEVAAPLAGALHCLPARSSMELR